MKQHFNILEMTFEHDYARSKSIHRVVYIEYHGRRVHAVITDHKRNDEGKFSGFQTHFDFEQDCQGCEKFMFYHSGSGGRIKEIAAPTYAKGVTDVSYWLHPEAAFTGKPKNIFKRESPIKYKGDPNPFNNGREIYQQNFCKICGKIFDENYCPAHHSINEKGELVYPDGSKAED